jgi:CelD/BcsL family acetyltransferase involved in cellulose biosynthesis
LAENVHSAPAVEDSGVAVVAHEGPDALEALRAEWDALLKTCARPTPFLTHAWAATSWRYFAGNDRLLTLTFRQGERLVGVLPLRVTRRPFVRLLQVVVRDADYADLLMASGVEWEVVRALCRWLREDFADWDLLRLRGLHSRSGTAARLLAAAAMDGLEVLARTLDPCPFVALPSTLGDLYDAMPMGRRLRKGLARRGRKLLQEEDGLGWAVATGGEVTPALMDEFIALHGRCWSGRSENRVLDNEHLRRFHRDLLAALVPTGAPVMLQIRTGDRPIAMCYGFRVGRVYLDYMGAYDPEYRRYSVGRLADLRLLEQAVAWGLSEVDLGKGGEAHKFDYTHDCAYTLDCCIARNRGKLRLYTTWVAVRGALCR